MCVCPCAGVGRRNGMSSFGAKIDLQSEHFDVKECGSLSFSPSPLSFSGVLCNVRAQCLRVRAHRQGNIVF